LFEGASDHPRRSRRESLCDGIERLLARPAVEAALGIKASASLDLANDDKAREVSRAFTEFAQGDLPDRMHAALINRALGGRIIGAIARDATEIEAREKPVEKKDGPPPPSASVPPQNKRGRPRKGQERSSERPKPEPTRLERQTTQNASQMLADLPTACDVGATCRQALLAPLRKSFWLNRRNGYMLSRLNSFD
jgi:hypothetical protein